jgi:glycosyltransferase involved in cell wall biosynthesis
VGIVNIELLRYTELKYYHYFDLILANNESSYNILKDILPYTNVQLLEFNNYYMKKNLSIRNNQLNNPTETVRIATFGGLNSYVRKNIDKTYLVFKQLESQYKMTKKYNFKLNVYIQGMDKAVQSSIVLKDTENISVHFNNYSYSEIIALINDNDIVIHLGDHEGLGLGFFEALNNNKTLITLNTYPNSEYILDGVNGYLVNCSFDELTDNSEGITNRAIVNLDNYYKLMEKILANTYRPTLYKVIMANKNIVNNYEKNFIRVLKNI